MRDLALAACALLIGGVGIFQLQNARRDLDLARRVKQPAWRIIGECGVAKGIARILIAVAIAETWPVGATGEWIVPLAAATGSFEALKLLRLRAIAPPSPSSKNLQT